MAVEWTITIEGKNEIGDVCRRPMRITKSWESLFGGDIGLSIAGGKNIMATLQSAVVAHEAEAYSLFRLQNLTHTACDQCVVSHTLVEISKRLVNWKTVVLSIRRTWLSIGPEWGPWIGVRP